MIDASLISALDALNALSPLFSSPISQSFGNPLALAAQAQAALSAQNQFPPQQVLALSGLFGQAQALGAAAAPLASSPAASPSLVAANSPVLPPPPYTQAIASSSNASAITATAEPGATLTSYQLTVTQLGVAQANQGNSVANSSIAITTGAHALTITTSAGTTTVNYNIPAGSKAQNALNVVAAAVNNASLGITATVTTAGANSTLTFSANNVGTANEFSISDAAGGNVINRAFGTSTINQANATTPAQDTLYTLNGVSYNATSGNPVAGAPGYNSVNGNTTLTLDNGKLTVNLLTTASSTVTITVSANNTNLANTVTNLVNAFNNFQSFLTANASSLSPQIQQQLQGFVQNQANALASIGITVGTGGALSVNQTTLQNAASSAPFSVQAAISGPHGLAQNLAGFASEIGTGLQAVFAGAAPPSVDQSTLATALAQNFSNVLLGGQLAAGSLINVHG